MSEFDSHFSIFGDMFGVNGPNLYFVRRTRPNGTQNVWLCVATVIHVAENLPFLFSLFFVRFVYAPFSVNMSYIGININVPDNAAKSIDE